jgi:hypothetical protein
MQLTEQATRVSTPAAVSTVALEEGFAVVREIDNAGGKGSAAFATVFTDGVGWHLHSTNLQGDGNHILWRADGLH